MSITTELQRISQAKADLKTAIESKEVTIKENATIDTYAGKVDEVYSKGFEDGQAEGGGDSWYDTFWDNYQLNGERETYQYAFSYSAGWNGTTIKPKYPVKPTNAQYMFYGCGEIEDLTQCGEFDFSLCKRMSNCFNSAKIKKIGVVDNKSTGDWTTSTFDSSTIETIEKLISYPTNAFSSSFTNATALRNIEIEGTIAKNFSISQSPLTIESLKSIITHLANHAGTSSEFKYTVTFKATCWEALDAAGATAEANGKTWREYINDLGWNVG